MREEGQTANVEIESETAQVPHARELPPEVANVVGSFVPIGGASGSWGRNKVPDVADPAREACPPAQRPGWAQWASGNPKFAMTRGVKVLFSNHDEPQFHEVKLACGGISGFPQS
jgi:hypothetical protein